MIRILSKIAAVLESMYHMKVVEISIRAHSRRNSDAMYVSFNPEKPTEFTISKCDDSIRNKLTADLYNAITAPEPALVDRSQ